MHDSGKQRVLLSENAQPHLPTEHSEDEAVA